MDERHLIVLDTAVPAAVAAVVVVGETLNGQTRASLLPIVLGLGAALALVGRRRWPGWTLIVSGALVAMLFHVSPPAAAVAVLAPAVALYSVALRRGRVEQIAAGVLAIAAVVTADEMQPGRPGLGQTLAHVMLVAVPLLAAQVIRIHQANVRLLVERLEMADQAREQEAQRRAEQERMRIARELHDVLAHTLTEINVTAAATAEQIASGRARDALEQIECTSHAALGELRGILKVLRGPESAKPLHGPTPGIGEITALVGRARAAGLKVCLDVRGTPPARVSDASSLAAYRIVQESLTNIRRHAVGADSTVTLAYHGSRLTVTVDNGPGTTNGEAAAVGVGVAGMQERAAAVGGRLHAAPTQTGFQVSAELPYEPSP